MCALRIYAAAPLEEDNQKWVDPEEKDREQPYAPGEMITGDMSTLKDIGLDEGGRVEVEVYFTLEVAVVGKGSGYHTVIEVDPNETMDVIRSKVPFFKMFT